MIAVITVMALGCHRTFAVDGPTPYPDPRNEALWPGKGPIRSFGFQVGERQAHWKNRQRDQGAIVFVGDSLTGGWKNLYPIS
jgi:hypothetical protein